MRAILLSALAGLILNLAPIVDAGRISTARVETTAPARLVELAKLEPESQKFSEELDKKLGVLSLT